MNKTPYILLGIIVFAGLYFAIIDFKADPKLVYDLEQMEAQVDSKITELKSESENLDCEKKGGKFIEALQVNIGIRTSLMRVGKCFTTTPKIDLKDNKYIIDFN